MDENIAEKGSRRPLELTTSGILFPDPEGGEPIDIAEWIRLPAPGERCFRTGLSRGSYNDLIFADPPKIESVVLKKPGATRGVRLIRWSSVRSYLNRLAEEQNQNTKGGAS